MHSSQHDGRFSCLGLNRSSSLGNWMTLPMASLQKIGRPALAPIGRVSSGSYGHGRLGVFNEVFEFADLVPDVLELLLQLVAQIAQSAQIPPDLVEPVTQRLDFAFEG